VNISVESVRRQTPSAKLAQGGGPTVLISLDAIRKEAGPRWEKLRDTIYARLEALLRSRLSTTDFFLPIDDVSYLVSLPKSSAEDAQVCCLRIAYELHSSLLGPCSIQQLQIARAFSVGDDYLEITPIVSHQLINLAERAQILDLLVSNDGEPSSPLPLMLRNGAPPDDVARCQFVPIWDVRKQVIWAYRCQQFASIPMLTFDSPSAQARAAIRLALGSLRRVALCLDEHLARGERFILYLPVSYETLTAPIARMEFASACRQLPCDLRPYLVLEIVEMPVGVPHSRLVDLVGSFQSFGRGVAAQVPLHCPQLSIYEGTGLMGLGFSLAPSAISLPALEIERLCAVGKRLGINTFLDNISTADALQGAIRAGVHWLSGPAVSSPVPEPKPMSRLRKETVLQNAAAPSRASGQGW